MKKIYMKPKMNIVKVHSQHLLAGSTPQVGVGDPYSGGGVGARGYYWDDEE